MLSIVHASMNVSDVSGWPLFHGGLNQCCAAKSVFRFLARVINFDRNEKWAVMAIRIINLILSSIGG